MDARRTHRSLKTHAVVDDVEQHLEHSGDDATAARSAEHEPDLSIPDDDRRRHRRQHALVRSNRVRLAADEAKHVWRAGPRGEVIHLVVEQEAAARDDIAATERVVDRRRARNRVAVLVDHGEVRRVVALLRARWQPWGHFTAPVGAQPLPKRVCVGFRHQPFGRNRVVIRIAEPLRTVRVCTTHHFGQQVQRATAAVAHAAQVIGLQQVQHLQQRHAARRRRRHADHFVAAIGAAHRRALDCAVTGEVLFGDEPA